MFQCLHGKLCVSRRLNTKLMENGIDLSNKDVSYDSAKVRHSPKLSTIIKRFIRQAHKLQH